jgi:cytochrome c oxidase subunit 3
MISEKINIKAKKMMLLIGMVSMTMTFAGLTSAYVVSSSRSDWLNSFEMPIEFTISTFIIILSSITFGFAKHFNSINSIKKSIALILFTILLAFIFIFFQFQGFGQIINSGYYFTGAQSSITTSFLYVLVMLHMLHLFAGIIVLFVVLFNLIKGKYSAKKTLGIELGVIFWHFLDFLWCYLYLFVVLYK